MGLYVKIYVCPKNSYVSPSFSYIQFSILTQLFALPFPNISFSFYWPTPFSTIIVADLIKCVSIYNIETYIKHIE